MTLGRSLLAALLLASFASACASRPAARPRGATAPPAAAGWSEEGLASWYGGDDGFEGKPTASGEIYDSSRLTAAHRELPLGSVVEVANVSNGKTVRVRINDRGPFVAGRVIDLSREAARQIDLIGPGVGPVRLTLVETVEEPMPISASGLWAVQVGSFGEPGRAERHAANVGATGRSVYFQAFRGLTRVKVGPFDSRDEAEEVLRALEEAGFEGIVVPEDGR